MKSKKMMCQWYRKDSKGKICPFYKKTKNEECLRVEVPHICNEICHSRRDSYKGETATCVCMPLPFDYIMKEVLDEGKESNL